MSDPSDRKNQREREYLRRRSISMRRASHTRESQSLTVAGLVDGADPLDQVVGPLEWRAERHGGVAAPLREHDVVAAVLERKLEPAEAGQRVLRQLEAQHGVLTRPAALAPEHALHLHGGGVGRERLHARLEGGRRAVGAPRDVGALAVRAARRRETATAEEADQSPPERRAAASPHRSIATALAGALCCR